MAGAHIDITTTGMAELLRGLQGLEHSAQHLEPAMRDIGEYLIEAHHQRWGQAQSPDGVPWAPLSPVTIERKGHGDILRDSDTLRGTLAYQLGGDELLFGSNLEYAAMMQFGGTKEQWPHLWGDIPARPFIGISADDEAEILAILSEHLSGPLTP